MGMTDKQYKGMLMDELEDWQEILKAAENGKPEEVIEKAKRQIAKITEKLKA